ncbi:MAG: helix-turn-helix domain-containing protein [Myxococcota bacterium]|nr:helix-turn-helix domain-containing protein [Myxococcota bacterium]
MCGLYSPERLHVVQRRIDEACDTLLDAERRRRYDLKLFPDGIPPEGRRRRPAGDSGEQRPVTDPRVQAPELPVLSSETEFTGPLLQRLRESRQIELPDIAARTKIGIAQLRAIEAEQWDALPASVYLRGFLTEYAKCLRLEPQQVVRSYLERFQRERGEV